MNKTDYELMVAERCSCGHGDEIAPDQHVAPCLFAEVGVVCVEVNQGPQAESDEDFLKELKELGEDWRFSDEFIGIVVRCRFPRRYP